MVPDDRKHAAGRSAAPDVRLAMGVMVAVFALFILIGVTAGLVFNTITIALPKVIDERIGSGISLVAVGGIATVVFLCGAVAQFTDRARAGEVSGASGVRVHRADAVHRRGLGGLCHRLSCCWSALAFAMAFIYAQVTVNDFVIARYTADAWRAPCLCGALLHHLSDLGRGDHHDRVPA